MVFRVIYSPVLFVFNFLKLLEYLFCLLFEYMFIFIGSQIRNRNLILNTPWFVVKTPVFITLNDLLPLLVSYNIKRLHTFH